MGADRLLRGPPVDDQGGRAGRFDALGLGHDRLDVAGLGGDDPFLQFGAYAVVAIMTKVTRLLGVNADPNQLRHCGPSWPPSRAYAPRPRCRSEVDGRVSPACLATTYEGGSGDDRFARHDGVLPRHMLRCV